MMNINDLRNINKDKPVLIVGAGPSLNLFQQSDIDKFYSIGLNYTYRRFKTDVNIVVDDFNNPKAGMTDYEDCKSDIRLIYQDRISDHCTDKFGLYYNGQRLTFDCKDNKLYGRYISASCAVHLALIILGRPADLYCVGVDGLIPGYGHHFFNDNVNADNNFYVYIWSNLYNQLKDLMVKLYNLSPISILDFIPKITLDWKHI